jgi:hypothetical protein
VSEPLSPEALDASRALAQTLAAERGMTAALWLRQRASHRKRTSERLAEMLVELRSWGADIHGAMRLAEAEIARLGIEADIPVHQYTGPTPASPLRLVDTGPTSKDD